jgi:hypothetical protein
LLEILDDISIHLHCDFCGHTHSSLNINLKPPQGAGNLPREIKQLS